MGEGAVFPAQRGALARELNGPCQRVPALLRFGLSGLAGPPHRARPAPVTL